MEDSFLLVFIRWKKKTCVLNSYCWESKKGRRGRILGHNGILFTDLTLKKKKAMGTVLGQDRFKTIAFKHLNRPKVSVFRVIPKLFF